MSMSAVARATAIASSVLAKKGQRACMRRAVASPWARKSQPRPVPAPNQPGTICRDCVHAKTQGMARRSASESCPVRRAGREPRGICAISAIGVEASKYARKSGSPTSPR